jgi:hypothetical protein
LSEHKWQKKNHEIEGHRMAEADAREYNLNLDKRMMLREKLIDKKGGLRFIVSGRRH